MLNPLKTLMALVVFAGIAFCQRPQTDIVADKQTLANQPRMAVAVDTISIPGFSFRADVENAVREAGITLLSSTDRAPSYPLLRAKVTGTIVNRLQPPQLSYFIALEFVQLLPLGDGKYARATTWSSNHSGILPWNGIVSSSQVVDEVRKDVMSLLSDFVEDWREVNSSASSAPAAPASHLFDGVWRGTYACTSGFGGGGQSTWTIREVRPGRVEVDEQWVRFLSGHNSYTGTITGRTLEVKTNDLGGYSVNLTLSRDNATLAGKYVGHPNQCQTITLRKLE
jgi:hypothetical protein